MGIEDDFRDASCQWKKTETSNQVIMARLNCIWRRSKFQRDPKWNCLWMIALCAVVAVITITLYSTCLAEDWQYFSHNCRRLVIWAGLNCNYCFYIQNTTVLRFYLIFYFILYLQIKLWSGIEINPAITIPKESDNETKFMPNSVSSSEEI